MLIQCKGCFIFDSLGSLADVIGRKKIFVATAILISIGSFGSACSGNSSAFTVYGQLACWRLVKIHPSLSCDGLADLCLDDGELDNFRIS